MIRLSNACRADIAWWREFVESWNGVSFLQPPQSLPTVEVTTDASGTWSCGAQYNTSWFQVSWGSRASSLSIAANAHHSHVCSMGAVLARLPGSVQMRQPSCGGSPPVTVRKEPGVMHLLRCLTYIEAQIGCHLYGVYIDTHSNHLADDLSRNHVLSFPSKVPSADSQPTPTSPDLLSLLLNPQADWILQQWRQRFSAIFRKAWPRQPARRMEQQ